MEQIEAIQSLVDEHKEKMPTGVVTDLMKQCQEAFNRKSKLYKLTWVHVKAVAADVFDDECDYDRTLKVMAIPQMQTSLAEVKAPHQVVWVGMPCAPTRGITPEDRARAWARHGLEPPTSFGGPRRDVYGNICD